MDRKRGSDAGLARVARLGDGWLASAYNTTPERFAAAHALLARALVDRGRDAEGFPNALAAIGRGSPTIEPNAIERGAGCWLRSYTGDPDPLSRQVCVGSVEHCIELLSRYAEAGCERVYLSPLGQEQRQLELVAGEVAPKIGAN